MLIAAHATQGMYAERHWESRGFFVFFLTRRKLATFTISLTTWCTACNIITLLAIYSIMLLMKQLCSMTLYIYGASRLPCIGVFRSTK